MSTVLGLHQNEWHNSHLDYIREEQPTADLILDPSDGEVAAVKGASPQTNVITRFWEEDSSVHNEYMNGDPVAAGRRWAAKVLSNAGRLGKYSIIINEPPCTVEALARQAQAEIAFMKALDADGRGFKAGIGAFSGGNLQHPSIDGGAEIRAYEPALRYAKEHGHALFIHLYFVRPAMGGPTPSGLVHDPRDLALRWTQSILPWMRANGVPIPDIYVTEFGEDLGFARDLYGFTGEAQGVGWKSPAPWGYGDTEAGARQYASDLIAVATAICRNAPEIKSLLLYCAGDNGTHKWRSFMADGYLLRYLATQALPQPTEQPAPPPPPVPPTGGNMTLTDRFIQLARAKWGNRFEDLRATLPKHATLKFNPIDSRLMQYICFHHTATAINATWKRIAEAHIAADPARNKEEWAGIGYHLGFRQGKVSLLADLDTQRAHVKGRNHEALGLVWMGNSDTVPVPDGDKALMREAVELLDELYARDKELTWHGKMLVNYTECPGSSMKQIVPTLRAPVAPPPLAYTDEERAKAKWFTEQLARTLRGDPDATATLISALISEPKKAGLHNVLVARALPSLERA